MSVKNHTPEIPDKIYFKIGEVCNLTSLKPYILRYWETEFKEIRPQKSRSGQRLYKREDLEIILKVRQLLHDKKYTIAGAKKVLHSHGQEAQEAMNLEEGRLKDTLQETIDELKSIRSMLDN